MVESLIVLILLLAGFLLFYDFAYGAVARLLLDNATARAARADTVGFNDFHRTKAFRVGMIPVAGKRLVPDGERTVEGTYSELSLIRTYLQSENWSDADGILDYERWHGLTHQIEHRGNRCEVYGSFKLPLQLPARLGAMFSSEYVGESCSTCNTPRTQTIKSTWQIEDHASYYLLR